LLQLTTGVLQQQRHRLFELKAEVGAQYVQLASAGLQRAIQLCKSLKYCELECGPMPNLMVALPNIGGALCSTPQSLADAHY